MLLLGQRAHDKAHAMRLLLRLATALLLGGFVGFSTTCGGLGLGSHYHPLAAQASNSPAKVAPTRG